MTYENIHQTLLDHVMIVMRESPECVRNNCQVSVNGFEIISSSGLYRMIASHEDKTQETSPVTLDMVWLEDGNIGRWLAGYHATETAPTDGLVVGEDDPPADYYEYSNE